MLQLQVHLFFQALYPSFSPHLPVSLYEFPPIFIQQLIYTLLQHLQNSHKEHDMFLCVCLFVFANVRQFVVHSLKVGETMSAFCHRYAEQLQQCDLLTHMECGHKPQ